MAIATFVISTVIAFVGLYLAHSLRRQQRLKIAERRMSAYGGLWQIMELARSSRLQDWDGAGPLNREDAKRLFDKMTKWYYELGNGMVLTNNTKELYLRAKQKLGAYCIATTPAWEDEGERRIRELSLLRTQMKLDLDIYGAVYFDLKEKDEAFLREAGLNPKTWAQPPWYRGSIERVKARAGRQSGRTLATVSPMPDAADPTGAGRDDLIAGER